MSRDYNNNGHKSIKRHKKSDSHDGHKKKLDEFIESVRNPGEHSAEDMLYVTPIGKSRIQLSEEGGNKISAFHLAIWLGDVNAVEFLLEKGLYQKDASGSKPDIVMVQMAINYDK